MVTCISYDCFAVNCTHKGETPLGIACHRGDVEMCRVLLELGADPNRGGSVNRYSEDGRFTYSGDEDSDDNHTKVDMWYKNDTVSPLWAAALSGSTEIVTLLIHHGAIVDFNRLQHTTYRGGYWAYPSVVAIQDNDIEMLKVFIECSADFPTKHEIRRDPDLFFVDFTDCTEQMMEFFVSLLNEGTHKAIVNYLVVMIRKLFVRVLDDYEDRSEDFSQLSCFFNAGLLYKVRTSQWLEFGHCISPVHAALKSKKFSIFAKLLEAGANVDEKDEAGCTPLHLAATADDLEMCRMLLQYGAAVNETDDNGWSALQRNLFSCGEKLRENTKDICDLFLSAGADILLEKGDSRSAFRMSVSFDDDCLIETFLAIWDSRFGGNNHCRNDDGDLPIHAAVTNPNISLPNLNVLLKHSSKLFSLPDGQSRWLPLHLACMWGADLDVIFSILLQYPSAVDKNVVSELMLDASD